MTTEPERHHVRAKGGRIPLRLRIKAWWKGYDLHVVHRRPETEAQEPPGHNVHYEREAQPWERGRIALAQRLWGDGYISAGGADLVHELVKPCALSGASSVLELGAGLGGCARLMAESYGAWVTALEEDPALAEAGRALSQAAGLGKRAVVAKADLTQLAVKPRGYDLVFAKECFYRIDQKEALLDSIVAALKPKGQLVFTDVLVNQKQAGHETLAQWKQQESSPVHPWSLQQWNQALAARRFEVHVAEDISERWVAMVRQPWAELLEQVQGEGIPPEEGEALVSEGELWNKRAAAVESGALRVYRFFARISHRGPM